MLHGEAMAALTLALATFCAQELPTGASVVDKYVKAKGGAPLLKKTTSYRLLVEIYIDGKKTADSEVMQAEGRHLTINTLLDGSTTSHGTDGKAAWYIDQVGVIRHLKGPQLADYLRHYTTVHEALKWPRQFASIRCVGRKKIQGQEAYEVKFTPKDGVPVTRYFAVASGLFLREVQQTDTRGTKAISDIAEYRRIKGVLVPHKRTVTIGKQVTEYRVRRAENNVTFAKDRFLSPKSNR
jgi:hypothetical protein